MRMFKSLVQGLSFLSVFLSVWAGSALANTVDVNTYKDGNFSTVFERMANSFGGAPVMIGAAAYLAAIIMAVAAILKLKEAMDNPGNVSFREPLARALIAGALFAMPFVMGVAMGTIGPQTGGVGVRAIAFDPIGGVANQVQQALGAAFGGGMCDGLRMMKVGNAALQALGNGGILAAFQGGLGAFMNGGTLGESICYAASSFGGLPYLLETILYIAGIFLIFWGLLQLRDHLISPDRAPISAPLKKILLAGAFFAFPYITEVVQASVAGTGNGLAVVNPAATLKCAAGGVGNGLGALAQILAMFNGGGGGAGGGGLDCMMTRLITDIWGPVQLAVSVFCYLAGIIMIALAMRRMLDGMDKGVRSPVGIGTLTMIAVGGALLSFDLIIRMVSVSLVPNWASTLGLASLQIYGALSYAPGVGQAGMQSINNVITVVFMFSFLVGIISILRGLFILKEVNNGGNASLMAGFTHILGGGLAVNLGPVIMAVQSSLGLSGLGIKAGITPF